MISVTSGHEDTLSPHGQIEKALASCTTLTLGLYSARKNWDITGLRVEVEILKEGKETLIERRIFFGDKLNTEEKTRLIEIANKCPIHKLLTSHIEIQTYEK